MGSIKQFKYKLIKNFLTQEEVEIGSYYFNLLHKRNMSDFDLHQSNNLDSQFYGDSFTDTILMKKLNLVEKESGLDLFPTYSYTRVYTFNSDLKKHKDRPSCEISISTMWCSDGTKWPIYMDNNPLEMNPGDAVIYAGCEVEHWRNSFEGDYHIQSFLHYVDQNGIYKDFKYDKRNARENCLI
jgi:hypothetical protein